MKKILSLLLAGILLLTGCSPRGEEEEETAVAPTTGFLYDGTYTATSIGFEGPISIELTISSGEIIDIQVTEEQETPGIGDKAFAPILQAVQEENHPFVHSVSGATVTSSALLSAIESACSQAGYDVENHTVVDYKNSYSSLTLGASDYQYDVVVVGSGGAGLSAAIAAAEKGAQVAVVEKNSFSGGSTRISYGALSTTGHPQTGPDSPSQFLGDLKKAGGANVHSNLAEIVANKAGVTLKRLESYGLSWERAQQFPGHSTPRTLVPKEHTGVALVEALEEKARSLGVSFFFNTSATDLITENGVVTGVAVKSRDKNAIFASEKGVILATGGYGLDTSFIKEQEEDFSLNINNMSYEKPPIAPMEWLKQLDAKLINLSSLQITPYGTERQNIAVPFAESLLEQGALLVNQIGQPYQSSYTDPQALAEEMQLQPHRAAYLIWTEEMEKESSLEPYNNLVQSLLTSRDMATGATLEQVADSFMMDRDILFETASKENFIPIGKISILQIVPGVSYSLGGVAVTSKAQVLDTDNQPIPHLYAAGEIVGGIHGDHALEGNMILSALVFGQIAGEQCAN